MPLVGVDAYAKDLFRWSAKLQVYLEGGLHVTGETAALCRRDVGMICTERSDNGLLLTANPAASLSSERRLGTLICPRQGEVGSCDAYCQLLIQPIRIGFASFGSPLKLMAQ